MTTATLYDQDFYAWTQTQAALLRQAQFSQLDIANLIEELDDMGKSQKRQLESRLEVLIAHLLKWQFQSEGPGSRSSSWLGTIRVQRRSLQNLLADNPSLQHRLPEGVQRAYPNARDLAWSETGLPEALFPVTCPYTVQQILDKDFFPQG